MSQAADHPASRAVCAYCGEHARPNSMYCMACGQIVTLPPRVTAATRPTAPFAAPASSAQPPPRPPMPHLLPPPLASLPFVSPPSAPTGVPSPTLAPALATPSLAAPQLAAPRLSAEDAQAVELVLGSGARTRVHGTAVLGRSPEATARNAGAQAIAIPDTTKSVSRAHAIIEFQGRAVEIGDAGSANGSSVERDGVFIELGGDTRVSLRHGDRIWLGDVPIEVEISRGRRGAHA